MIVEQVSVFVENKMGRLAAVTKTLAQNGIDISALSLAENEEYGVLRLIVSNPQKAKQALNQSGVIVKITPVLAVAIEDVPGGFSAALEVLTAANVEIRYVYACVAHETGKALMIFSVEDPETADKLLQKTKYGSINPGTVYRI